MESLKLLETVKEPGTIVDSPFRWKRDRFEEMEEGLPFIERRRQTMTIIGDDVTRTINTPLAPSLGCASR